MFGGKRSQTQEILRRQDIATNKVAEDKEK